MIRGHKRITAFELRASEASVTDGRRSHRREILINNNKIQFPAQLLEHNEDAAGDDPLSPLSLLSLSPLSQHYLRFRALMRSRHCVTLRLVTTLGVFSAPGGQTWVYFAIKQNNISQDCLLFAECKYVSCHCHATWCYSSKPPPVRFDIHL